MRCLGLTKVSCVRQKSLLKSLDFEIHMPSRPVLDTLPACYGGVLNIEEFHCTMMVPAVWYRSGLSSLLCTREFGSMATGGTSTTSATFILYCMETEDTILF